MAQKGRLTGLAEQFERRWFLARKRLSTPRPASRRLIVVAGVQRSGTNMLMDLMEAAPRTDVIHERDPRLYDNYVMRNNAVVARLLHASAFPVIVIKALHEPERVRPLMDRFAPGKAVWLFRHWDDTVNSNRKSWPGGRNRLDDIVQDRGHGGWRTAAMDDETWEELRQVYHPGMNDETAQALFYYHRNKLVFDIGLADDPRVLVANYDAMLRQPEAELERLTRFLDLPLTPRMRGVPNAGVVRKRPTPAIEPAVAAMCASLYARLQAAAEPKAH